VNVPPAVWLGIESLPTFAVLRSSADDLERLARRRLRGLLEHASRTELGRRRAREAGVTGRDTELERDPERLLRALRPIRKPELRDAGAAALQGGCVDPKWRSSRSSGSTGEPFRVFYDVHAWVILKHLVKLRARAGCGMRPHHRVTLLDAIPPAEEGTLGMERLGRLRRISVLRPADQIAAALHEHRPEVVYGLPSTLAEVATVLQAERLRISVQRVFTSGELLHGAARRVLREAYGCAVYDVYGTSETKEIAWECPAGSMHINADVVLVEILDASGERCEAGEEGEIVVSLLVNRAMPLVRYATGDRGSLLTGHCRCGLMLPRLGVVTGREVDVLELDGGRRLSPYALTSALEQVEGMLRYQVSQLDTGRLRVRAHTTGAGEREATASDIRAAIRAAAGPIAVDVEFVERFETGPRGKFHVVQPS
jgi:phenylacetate-CoA ligase